MAVTHRPARKSHRSSPRPRQGPVVPAAAPPAEQAAASAAIAPGEATAEVSGDRIMLLLRERFTRLAALLDKAERTAEAMLDALLVKAQRREVAYPGELTQVCRGLQMLARCGAELGRMVKLAGWGVAARGITSADIDKLAARLWPCFEQQPA